MFSLDSHHRGDSNEYTQCTIFNIKKKITLNYPKLQLSGFSEGLMHVFEPAMVNEPSVSELLKFYLCQTTVSAYAFFLFIYFHRI